MGSERLLRLDSVKERVGLGKTAIYNLVALGQFPKQVSVGVKSVAWVESEVDRWISERIVARDTEK